MSIIAKLDISKACHESDIPKKILKENVDLFSPFLINFVHRSKYSSTFPSVLKLANVTPVIKRFTTAKSQLLACPCPTQSIQNL